MTLPSDGKKLSDQEAQSIEIAIEESGLTAVHPERMEALADRLVEKLKAQPKGHATNMKGWRTCNALDD
jgi:hypothetical protein|tara:strand:- start:79 stop:285 length:207 start_codon:yes stop_codon:yes gene_type:complete